jgi:hypothetical protein
MDSAELEREIRLYAQDEWRRRQADYVPPDDDDVAPSSVELQRAILAMTDYSERYELHSDGDPRRSRLVRPLDAVVPGFGSGDALADHLVERAQLSARTSTGWWWAVDNDANRRELKARLESVNEGKERTVSLPARMTVTAPTAIRSNKLGAAITLIDSRGLDGSVESRRDILDFMRDPHAIIVLCSSFSDAPDEAVRSVLRAVKTDVDLAPVRRNAILLLLDRADAEQVNGAQGDRILGQRLKINECHRVLESAGLSAIISADRVVAFDSLEDNSTVPG